MTYMEQLPTIRKLGNYTPTNDNWLDMAGIEIGQGCFPHQRRILLRYVVHLHNGLVRCSGT